MVKEHSPPCTPCVCVCLYVHKSPWQEVSRKWRDFHSSVYFHISAKNIWLHSKQIDGIREKEESHRALKNEQGNVNIMYQTNIFVCGFSFQGLIDMCKDHSCLRMWVLKSPASGSTSQTFLNRSSSLLLEWAGLSWTNGTRWLLNTETLMPLNRKHKRTVVFDKSTSVNISDCQWLSVTVCVFRFPFLVSYSLSVSGLVKWGNSGESVYCKVHSRHGLFFF